MRNVPERGALAAHEILVEGPGRASMLQNADGRVRLRFSVSETHRPCDLAPGTPDRRSLASR